MTAAHDKIIKEAAKEVLAPLGMFQVGQSRCWIDDNGWFVIQVEFQPSKWSKGAYLNVGISFLWEGVGIDVLSFDVGHREKEHMEYEGNDDKFRKEMLGLAEHAKDKVLHYRRFGDPALCKENLKTLAAADSFWGNWKAAMFCFLMGCGDGRGFLRRMERFDVKSFARLDEISAKSRELITKDDAYLMRYVKDSVRTRREFLKKKSSFKKLREWNTP